MRGAVRLGTIAVSVVTVIALAGVSFAGIRTLNGTGEQSLMPADISPYDSGRYPVFERTAQIESLSVTSPSDWYLVNQWPLGSQLATQAVVGCDDLGSAVPRIRSERLLRRQRLLWPQWFDPAMGPALLTVARARCRHAPAPPTVEP